MNNIRIRTLQRKMKLYYKKSSRALPWRTKNQKNQDPYKTLISEIMLQQTRVNAVLEYYKNFLKKFPDLESLACANENDILVAWSGLGYYRRARNLHKTAKIIIKEYESRIPSDKIVLKQLPGIGEYTSSAIASFAFGKEELVIDTNVERFIKRIFNINASELSLIRIKELGEIIFPKKNRGDFAQAIMDFSNDYCTKLSPKCSACIISKYCEYEGFDDFKKIKLKKNKKYCISYFIYDSKELFLIRRKPIEEILGGMYEVPSSIWKSNKKIEDMEVIKLDKNYNPMFLKNTIKHEFSHFTLFSKVMIIKKEKIIKNSIKGKWVDKNTIKKYPISNLTKKIINYSLEEVASLRKFL